MDMKIAVFLIVIAGSQALPVLLETNSLVETGASAQYKTEDNHGNYAFGYTEDHTSGGSFRKEQGDSLGNKVGSYGLHDADGRARVVNYVADSAGFRADVHTNEPGVDPSQDPAAVAVNKPALVAHAPAIVAPAPAVVHHAPAIVAPAPAVVHHASTVLAPAVALAPHPFPLTYLHPHLHHAPLAVTSVLAHGPHFVL